MPTLHLLRVFCADNGSEGNPLGVFLDGDEVAPELRQAVAADLGLSETVFVDDAERGEIRIFTPAEELDFAGHPTVGTAWLLDGVDALRPPAGEVPVRRDGEFVYVAARPEWGPPWELAQLASADEVEALDGPPDGHDLTMAWAWIDEGAGTVRARAFPVAHRHRRGRGNRVSRDQAVRVPGTADRHPPGPRLAHPRPPEGR